LFARGLLHTQFDPSKHCDGSKPHIFIVIEEPVKEWTEHPYSTQKFGEPVDPLKQMGALQLFYSDMSRYGFWFQVKAFTSRCNLILERLGVVKALAPHAHIHIIAERSIIADRTMFENVYVGKHITTAEWDVYNEFFKLMTEHIVKKSTGMIYVKTSPSRCYERKENRARSAEQGAIAPDYLVSLDKLFDKMVDDFRDAKSTNYVETVDFEDDVPPESINTVAIGIMDRLLEHVALLV
jgi:deoxyadenosine/deoxycytidine kinase